MLVSPLRSLVSFYQLTDLHCNRRSLVVQFVDEAVLDAATQGDALLLTDDKDFGDLVYRQHLQTLGVLLIRLAKLSNDKKAEIIVRVLSQYGAQLIRSFTVVMPGSVRIRKPPTAKA